MSTNDDIPGVRSDAPSGVDPRARRTRAAVLDALETLETEEDTEFTVSSIVERAGVSRSAFYKHFSGLDDLAAFVLGQAFAQIREVDAQHRQQGSKRGTVLLREDVTALVRHLAAHRRLYANVFRSGLGPSAAAAAQAAYIAQVHENLPNFSGGPSPQAIESDLVFFAGGLVALIVRWASGRPRRGDPEALIEDILSRIPSWQLADPSPETAQGLLSVQRPTRGPSRRNQT